MPASPSPKGLPLARSPNYDPAPIGEGPMGENLLPLILAGPQ